MAGLCPRATVRDSRPAANPFQRKLRTSVIEASAWDTAPLDIGARSDRASGYFDMATAERYASFFPDLDRAGWVRTTGEVRDSFSTILGSVGRERARAGWVRTTGPLCCDNSPGVCYHKSTFPRA